MTLFGRKTLTPPLSMLTPIEEIRERVKEIIESFPEGTTTLLIGLHLKREVRGKKFGWFMEGHHGDGRLAINCKALPGMQAAMVEANSAVYHVPSYVGSKGWVGIWPDVPGANWEEIKALLYDAYLLAAPKSFKTA